MTKCGSFFPLRILGVDPGSHLAGYGVIQCSSIHSMELIDCGFIQLPAELSLADRLHALYKALLELLGRHKPTVAALETQYMGKNSQSTIKLAMARAAIVLAARCEQVQVEEYTPSQVKQAVSGRGSATKEQVQRMVQLLLRLPSLNGPYDVADALAIAICHHHRSHRVKP